MEKGRLPDDRAYSIDVSFAEGEDKGNIDTQLHLDSGDTLHKRFAALAAPPALPCLRERRRPTPCVAAGALVSVGDRAFGSTAKVRRSDHRDDVGYTLGSYDRRGIKVEEWVYGPRNGVTYIRP